MRQESARLRSKWAMTNHERLETRRSSQVSHSPDHRFTPRYTRGMSRRRLPAPIERPPLSTRMRTRLPEAALAVAALVLVVADLDPTGAYSWLPDGPGLTIDESFNVEQGVRLEIGSRYVALGALSVRELFGTPDELGPDPPAGYHLPDHPPLGRYLLGVAHNIVTAITTPAAWPSPFVIAAARIGSAVAFAATVFAVAVFCARHYGRRAGVVAGVALILMPRVFGHAHIASLETTVGLFYTVTVLFLANRWQPNTPVGARNAMIGGVLFGLVLLTKVQAVLLPIPIALWSLWQWRQRAVVPLIIFGCIAGGVFFVGWPWLWFDPVDHVLEYLGRTTDRLSLPAWYQGQVFADKDVPWHYPFVMFAATVPLGLHLLGIAGVFGKCGAVQPEPNRLTGGAGDKERVPDAAWRDPAMQLVLACAAFPLLVFAIPGVAVYDGVRLFLIAYPLWAVAIGRGGECAYEWLRRNWSSKAAATVLAVFLLMQSYGVATYRPAYLSYYNLLVGGLAGAEKFGFEPTYWGDTVTAELLEAVASELPEGGTLAVSPVLHQFQLETLLLQSPSLQRKDLRLVEYGSGEAISADGLLVFFRKASLATELRDGLDGAVPSAAVREQGVTLAAFYRLPSMAKGE